eukprot:8025508-Pyramimonas_sp.AAC.1
MGASWWPPWTSWRLVDVSEGTLGLRRRSAGLCGPSWGFLWALQGRRITESARIVRSVGREKCNQAEFEG